jgi:ComEC/Rec2-related protein
MNRFLRYVFNLPNLFIFFLLFLTALNTFISIQDYHVNNQNLTRTLRVVEIQKDKFSRLNLTLEGNNGRWLIDNYKGESLKLGQEYEAIWSFTTLNSTDKNDLYDLSNGNNGKTALLQMIAKKGCDLYCRYLSFIDNLKYQINDNFLRSSCNTERWLTKFLAPNIACTDISSLSRGLLIGGVTFSPEAKQLFKLSGINHVVAVSGFQVVLIASFLEWLLGNSRLRRNWRIALILIFVFGFVTLVGPQPPIIRSFLSILISSFALLLGRSRPQNRILIYSAIIMLWLNPFIIFSISFQLSFLASFALINSFSIKSAITSTTEKINELVASNAEGVEILNITNLTRGANKFVFAITSILTTNLSIFLYTLPIIVQLNGFISPLSIIVNIILLPIVPVVSLLNIAALIPYIGGFINIFALSIESIILQGLNSILSANPTFGFGKFTTLETTLYYTILVLANIILKYYFDHKNSIPK